MARPQGSEIEASYRAGLSRRRFLVGLGAAGLSALLAGCDVGHFPSTPTSTPRQSPKPEPWQIGRSGLGDLSSWWIMQSAHLEYALNDLYKTRFAPRRALSANWDADKQVLDIEQLTRQGIDLLLVEPMNSPNVVAAANEAAGRSVPLILVSSPLVGTNCVTWVTTDEAKRGRASAEWLIQRVPRGRVMVLLSEPCQGSSAAWLKGVRNVLSRSTELQVDYMTSFWTPTESKRVMLAALTNSAAPTGLIVNHGTVAQGAVEALVERGLAVPPVAGADDNNGWLRVARQYDVNFLGFSGSTRLGRKVVDVACSVLSGESVPAVVFQPQTTFGVEQLDGLFRPELTDHYWADHELPEAWIQAMFARAR